MEMMEIELRNADLLKDIFHFRSNTDGLFLNILQPRKWKKLLFEYIITKRTTHICNFGWYEPDSRILLENILAGNAYFPMFKR